MTASTHRSPYPALKARQRELRDGFSPALALRTHRALSWLHRAEQEPEDHDARFLFLWISFNAAYANEITDRREFTERRQLVNFMNRLVDSDREKLLYEMIWRRYSQSIRTLIDNRHVFQPFWDHVRGDLRPALHAAQPAGARRLDLEQLSEPGPGDGRRADPRRHHADHHSPDDGEPAPVVGGSVLSGG